MSGVKYARTELIQHEMHEIEQILTKSDYKLASGQEKELLAKLARLEQMLLSTDLDLQMQLQKLRAIRDILHRLDSAIKEEDSEQKQSTANTDRDKEMQNLPALREKLAALIRQQTAHVAAATQLSGETPAADKSDDAAKPRDAPAEKGRRRCRPADGRKVADRSTANPRRHEVARRTARASFRKPATRWSKRSHRSRKARSAKRCRIRRTPWNRSKNWPPRWRPSKKN